VNGLVIDGCVFGTVDVPQYATGTGYKSRYLDLTGCINGILSNCTFACKTCPTGGKTLKAAGDGMLVPATVRVANCWGETVTAEDGQIFRTA
jgi:hypothetical protein